MPSLLRILCVSAQLPGHLDWGGYLATAVELAKRGHTLLWASGTEVAAPVTSAGLPFQPLAETGWRWPPPPPLPDDPAADAAARQRLKQRRALDQWLDPARVAAATVELGKVIRGFRPDLILSEMFVAASGLAAEAAQIPLAVVGWPAPAPRPVSDGDEMVAAARGRLDDLRARFGLTGANWTQAGPPALCSPHLHLTFWSAGWFEGLAVGSQTVHRGGLRRGRTPGQQPDPALPSPDDAPWVLITLGTSFNADPAFFVAAARAAEEMGCLPLIAAGTLLETPWVQALAPRLPPRAVLRPRLDFAVVLPFVAAAIHHGGAGTTHALVTHAVPQIVVPHAADQMRQAQGVMRSGVGRALPPREVTVARLADALAEVLPDRSPLRVRAQQLQAEFDALGGPPAAAEDLAAIH